MKNIIFVIFLSVSFNFAQTSGNFYSPNSAADRKEMSPNVKADSTATVADELNNRAVKLGLKNLYAEAVELLRKAIEIDPNSVIIRRNLGIALFNLKDFDEAIKLLKQVREKEVAVDAKTQGFLGEALFAVGEYEESLSAFQKALEIEPDNAIALYNYGSVLQELKHYQQALKNYDKAVALQPDLAKAFNNRGMTYFLLGNYQKAVADLQKAFALDASIVEVHNNLGVVFSQLGKKKSAHKYFLEAIRLRPDYDRAHYNLALNYHERSKPEEAFRHFLRLKSLNADLSEQLRKEMSKQFIVNASENKN